MKLKAFFLSLFIALAVFFTTGNVLARESNIPQYGVNQPNPGSSTNANSPILKFDIFSENDSDNTNYANTRVINVMNNTVVNYSLDFFYYNWYGSYPSYELSLSVKDSTIADIANYSREGAASEDIVTSTAGNVKTIKDNGLKEIKRMTFNGVNYFINPDYPTLSFAISGMTVGIVTLEIEVSATLYNDEVRTDTLSIIINVYEDENNIIPDIPSTMEFSIPSVHSGTYSVTYDNTEKIGVFKDEITTLGINIDSKIAAYNDINKVNPIYYRVTGESNVEITSVSEGYTVYKLKFITSSKATSSVTIFYYFLDSEGTEIELASYTYSFILYSGDEIFVSYNNKDFPEDNIYTENTPITISTTNKELEPFIDKIVLPMIPDTLNPQFLQYEAGYPYVIRHVSEDTEIVIGDRMLAESGLLFKTAYDYDCAGKFLYLRLTTENVKEVTYPTEIKIEKSFVFEIESNISRSLLIENIEEFPEDTNFLVRTNGIISANLDVNRWLNIYYENGDLLDRKISDTITIIASLGNGTILTKDITIILVPKDSYSYTFDKLEINMKVGTTETIAVGYYNPSFSVSDINVVTNIFVKNDYVIVTTLPDLVHFEIQAITAGDESIYFSIRDNRLVEVKVHIEYDSSGEDEERNYTFDLLNLSMIAGTTQTITLGYYENDVFVEADVNPIEDYFIIKNGNVEVKSNGSSYIRYDITALKRGYDSIYFIYDSKVIEVSIIVSDDVVNENINIEFSEGNFISMFKDNKAEITISPEYGHLLFNFMIIDDSIISFDSVYSNRIIINAIASGETQVFAYAFSEKTTYNAVITIKVFESLPNVNIIIEKEQNDLTSFTIYDKLKISFDANNFDFSRNTKYNWYINNELAYTDKLEFEQTFDAGTYSIKLAIIDIDNNISLDTTQELIVSAVMNEERTIGLNCDDIIYVDLNGGDFEIQALLDGVISPTYKYIWSVGNQTICAIKINGNERVILSPNYVGETTLTVMTNISKYEEIYIKAEIKIVVIEPKYTIEGQSFIKPNSNQAFKILGDGKVIYNAKPRVSMLVDGEEFTDYEIVGNEIIIKEIPKGKFSINLDVAEKAASLSFDSTNFNIREIAQVILPYLLAVAFVAVIVAFALTKRKTKLERADRKLQKLQKLVEFVLEKETIEKKDIVKLSRNAKRIKKFFTYCIDEGIDEINTLIPNIDKLIKILVATVNSNLSSNKYRQIVNNTNDRNIKILVNDFTIIKDEREAFEKKKQEKEVEVVVVEKGKKVKLSQEEYENYLLQSKYVEDEDGDD